jgi:4-hydroxyphenylpyruvate dioxygenase-like putative hemolysin
MYLSKAKFARLDHAAVPTGEIVDHIHRQGDGVRRASSSLKVPHYYYTDLQSRMGRIDERVRTSSAAVRYP